MYDDADIENMFPKLEDAPLQPNTDDWIQGDVEGWERSTEVRDMAAAAEKRGTRGHLMSDTGESLAAWYKLADYIRSHPSLPLTATCNFNYLPLYLEKNFTTA